MEILKQIFAIAFSFILFSLYSCKTYKNNIYSYTIETKVYNKSNSTPFISLHNYITYKGFLFEFITTMKENDIVNLGSRTTISTVTYDTTKLYIINSKNKQCYLFDTFSTSGKIIKTQSVTEKEFGNRPQKNTEGKDTIYNKNDYKPKDTILNNMELYFYDVNNIVNDSIRVKLFLIKNKQFNSIYKVNKIEYPDKNFCIIGFNVATINGQVLWREEMISKTQLDKQTIKICEKLISKTPN